MSNGAYVDLQIMVYGVACRVTNKVTTMVCEKPIKSCDCVKYTKPPSMRRSVWSEDLKCVQNT